MEALWSLLCWCFLFAFGKASGLGATGVEVTTHQNHLKERTSCQRFLWLPYTTLWGYGVLCKVPAGARMPTAVIYAKLPIKVT